MKTLAEHALDHHDRLRSLQYSPATLITSCSNVRSFLRWLEHTYQVRTPDQLRDKHFDQWLKYLSARSTAHGYPLKPRSINKQIENVRGLLKYLAQRGFLSGKLLDVLVFVKVPSLLPTSVLTHAQMKKLLAQIDTTSAAGYRNRTMLELLYSTGLRLSELLGIDVHDLNLDQGTVFVRHGKGNKQRVVPIGKTALRYLESYLVAVRPFLVRDPKERALFLDYWHKRPSIHFLGRFLSRYAKRAGIEIPVTPHTFRRSCTTELIRGGANLYHVKELLGHERLDTLKHYTKLTINDLRKTHARCHPRERDV
jgi:integrase/recombinase XerD